MPKKKNGCKIDDDFYSEIPNNSGKMEHFTSFPIKISQSDIIKRGLEKNLIFDINSPPYKNQDTPLKWICKNCNNKVNVSIKEIKKRKYPCKICRKYSKLSPVAINLIRNKIDKIIIKYNKNEFYQPKSLATIYKTLELVDYLDVSTMRRFVKDKYPRYYNRIWRINTSLSLKAEIFVIKRLDKEILKYLSGLHTKSITAIIKEPQFNGKLSRKAVTRIAKENSPTFYYRIWGKKVPQDLKNKFLRIIKKEISLYESGHNVRSIGKIVEEDFKNIFSSRWAQQLAENEFPFFYKQIWSCEQISHKEEIEILKRANVEIGKFKKGKKYMSLNYITENFFPTRTRPTISKVIKSYYPKEYELMWAFEYLTQESIKNIINDIVHNDLTTLKQIAVKNNTSPSTVRRISLQKVEGVYNNYEHSNRFPKDPSALSGIYLHQIINMLLTIDFTVFYEIKMFPNSKKRVDSIILDKNYLLKRVRSLPKFFNYLCLSKNDILNKKGFIFDYTSGYTSIDSKISKYYNDNYFFFVVGTIWFYEFENCSAEYSSYANLRIISHTDFAKLIGLDGYLLDFYNHAIGLNYKSDYERLLKFRDRLISEFDPIILKNADFYEYIKNL